MGDQGHPEEMDESTVMGRTSQVLTLQGEGGAHAEVLKGWDGWGMEKFAVAKEEGPLGVVSVGR